MKQNNSTREANNVDDSASDQIFKSIEQWPEQIGTREWRKRAYRELSPTVHEAFIAHSNNTNERGKEQGGTVSLEWEIFNAARAKRWRRRKQFDHLVSALQTVAWITVLFGAFWFFMWFNDRSAYTAIIVCVHVGVIVFWAALRLIEWRNALRDKQRVRFDS